MPVDATREHGHGTVSPVAGKESNDSAGECCPVHRALPTRPAFESLAAGPARHPPALIPEQQDRS
jgi:hypothetical protein